MRRANIPGLVVLVVVALAIVTAATTAGGRAPETEVVVEDWTAHSLGGRGVPTGWKTYETLGGRPAYHFTVAMDDGRRTLRLRSHDEHATIAKALAVDLKLTPVVEWSWKIVTLPAGPTCGSAGPLT